MSRKKTPSKKKKVAGKKVASKKVAGKKTAPKKKAGKVAGKKSPAKKKTRKVLPISQMKGDHWTLRLYIAGETPKSIAARENLARICNKHLPEKCTIEVVDLMEHPELARADQVLAIPTLVRRLPTPIKRIIGDLSDEERAMLALDVRKI